MRLELRCVDYFGKEPYSNEYRHIDNVSRVYFNTTKRIKISDLHPNQPYVDVETVAQKIKGKYLSIPYVLITNGCKVLIDGHHTVIAKIIKGQKYIYAKTYNP